MEDFHGKLRVAYWTEKRAAASPKPTDQATMDQLREEAKVLHATLTQLEKGLHELSDYSLGGHGKFSQDRHCKIIEALRPLYYNGPFSVKLTFDYDGIPADHFPIQVMFLKHKKSRKILFHDSFIAQLPEDLTAKKLPMKTLTQSVWRPTSFCRPKDTYYKCINGRAPAQEIKWTNLFQKQQIFSPGEYVRGEWEGVLANTDKALLIERNKPFSRHCNLAMYYGADEQDTYPDSTHMLFINNHGHVLYHPFCFYKRNRNGDYTDQVSHQINIRLEPGIFVSPEELYNQPEVEVGPITQSSSEDDFVIHYLD